MLRRIILLVVLLVIICLAWYGAEMLIYNYSQPSIVKAVVAVLWTMLLVSNTEKERVSDERVRELAGKFAKEVKERWQETNGENRSERD